MTSSPDGNAECAFVQVRAIEEDTAVGSDPVEDISTKERVATALVDTVGARLNAVFKRRKEPYRVVAHPSPDSQVGAPASSAESTSYGIMYLQVPEELKVVWHTGRRWKCCSA